MPSFRHYPSENRTRRVRKAERPSRGQRAPAEQANDVSFTCERMERVKGIEPSYAAWEAAVLPLNYTRRLCPNSYPRSSTKGKDKHASLFAIEPGPDQDGPIIKGSSGSAAHSCIEAV